MADPSPAKHAPIVSIICAVRNGCPYFSGVLDSIAAQTLPAWELIVVDDGSSDGSAELVRGRFPDDPRVTVIETSGVGRGHALNLALSRTSTPWIANVDADDPMHPERLARQLAAVQRHTSYDVLTTDALALSGAERPEWPRLTDGEPEVRDITQGLAYRNVVMHSAVLMRREPLLAVSGYDASRKSQFDYDLWVRLVQRGSRIGLLPLPLAAKRKHPAQSFEGKKRLRYVTRSWAVQRRAISAVGGPASAHAVAAGRAVYGLLPESIRSMFRQHLKSIGSGR